MDVTVTVEKPGCGHIYLTYHSGGKSARRNYLLAELRESSNPESVDEAIGAVESQVKKLILDNPASNLLELKNIVESEVFKI